MCDVIVIGAGVSGLTAARSLERSGLRVVVLDRSRGLGGRCATRRVEGVPVDHGVPFLHGRDARFMADLEAASAGRCFDWPRKVSGRGTPCQPRAFASQDTRRAFDAGVTEFAKYLGVGLDVRLRSRVVELKVSSSGVSEANGMSVVLDSGKVLRAPALVLAMPIPQASRLWKPLLSRFSDLRDNLPLLDLPQWAPCLAVMAGYSGDVEAPPWEAFYPADSEAIQAVFLDSSKRTGHRSITLVFHARPAFSRRMLDEDEQVWTGAILDAAAEQFGSWVAQPRHVQGHRWRFARVQPATELAAPLVFRVAGCGVLGLCGDAFDSAGGVEGAYLSGLSLASTMKPFKEDRDIVTDQS